MGKRPAEDELFVGNMGSIQREIRTSMQREDKPTMETGLERIAAKARSEPKLRFTSLAHHITRERVWTNLCQIPKRSAPGVDGQTVTEAKETFGEWVEPVLRSVHRQGYRAPNIRRVYIPKPGKREKRPLGVPCVNDRALQRSTAQVLSAIYEADFLPCSFGGRPERGAHHALATLNEVIAGGKVSWVLEADLKNFLGVSVTKDRVRVRADDRARPVRSPAASLFRGVPARSWPSQVRAGAPPSRVRGRAPPAGCQDRQRDSGARRVALRNWLARPRAATASKRVRVRLPAAQRRQERRQARPAPKQRRRSV